MKRGTVFPAWCDSGAVRGEFTWSLFSTAIRSRDRFIAGSRIRSGPRIARSRNKNVEAFLTSEAEWFWSIDSDMVWHPEALEQLLDVAHYKDRPIVAGWCYAEYQDGRIRPTLYRVTEDRGIVSVEMPTDFGYDKLVAVDATGAAFMLIHRSVFEAIEKAHEGGPHVWYQETSYLEQDVGEDITFCLRARAAGFPILVDPRIQVGHVKYDVITHDIYRQQQTAETYLTELKEAQ